MRRRNGTTNLRRINDLAARAALEVVLYKGAVRAQVHARMGARGDARGLQVRLPAHKFSLNYLRILTDWAHTLPELLHRRPRRVGAKGLTLPFIHGAHRFAAAVLGCS